MEFFLHFYLLSPHQLIYVYNLIIQLMVKYLCIEEILSPPQWYDLFRQLIRKSGLIKTFLDFISTKSYFHWKT